MRSASEELRNIFPNSEFQAGRSYIASELEPHESLVWVGGPSRWGLFRVTPFVMVVIVLFGYFSYLGAASDASAWQYLMMISSGLSGSDALIIPALAAGYLLLLGLALRDPRGRWTYVVTDRRLITFYKGRKLREAGSEMLKRLEVVKGIEGKIRNIGDVVWARVNRQHGKGGRGPDQGRHGFRGMSNPDQWRQRLMQWGEALQGMAAKDAKAFNQRAAEPDGHSTTSAGMRRLVDRRSALSMQLPRQWVGRIGLQERAPFRILGFTLPFQRVLQRSSEPLEEAPDEWNFIAAKGRSGMKFSVNINPGPPVATFERSRTKVGDKLFEADGEYRCGPLSGYRIDYRLLDDYYCRFAMLEGRDFHMLVNVTMPLDQAGDLVPAVDAVLDSIRAI